MPVSVGFTMKKSETDISRTVRDYLEASGCVVFRMNSGTWQNQATGTWIHGAEKGTADIIIGVPDGEGRFLLGAIEMKTPTGKLSDEQILFMRKMDERGIPWLVADCLNDALRFRSDPTYHGKERHVSDVLDYDKKYISAYRGRSKGADAIVGRETWERNKGIDSSEQAVDTSDIPF